MISLDKILEFENPIFHVGGIYLLRSFVSTVAELRNFVNIPKMCQETLAV